MESEVDCHEITFLSVNFDKKMIEEWKNWSAWKYLGNGYFTLVWFEIARRQRCSRSADLLSVMGVFLTKKWVWYSITVMPGI